MPSSTSSSRTYSVVEPHPNARPKGYIATGRGGAGNITRAPANLTKGSDAQGPPARIPLSSFSSSSSTASFRSHSGFHSGRGGAGNVHPSTERAIFSFDEELERQLSQDRHAAPVYHVGRGGAGNVAVSAFPKAAGRRSGSESEGEDRRSEKSVGSVESGADVATRTMRKGLKKIWSH